MRHLLIPIILVVSQVALAQNKQLLYNVPSLPQNLMTNPGAEVFFDKHIGLPLLSQVSFSVGSSGVSLYDIFGTGGGTVNDNIENSLRELTEKDFFSVREQLELVYLGWRDEKDNYFSAGVYQEADFFVYFPKDLAVLAWEGNEWQKNFSFSDLSFTGEVLTVFHFGLTHYYSEDLNIGIRGKLYSGILNIRSVENEGDFFSNGHPGTDDLSRPYLSDVDILIRTAGLSPLLNSGDGLTKFYGQAMFGGNLGAGVDLGFTYFFNDQYRFTGSLLDLGMVRNAQDIQTFHYFGEFDTGSQQGSILDPDHPDSGELGEYFHEEELNDPYWSFRPVKLNLSVDYGFREELEPCNCREPVRRRRYLNHVGFQLFSMKRPKGLVHAASLYFDKKFSEHLVGKVTYTADAFSYSNLGLLLSGKFSNFNLYLAADNLLDYTNLAKSRSASMQIGFQFIFDN